MKNKSLLITSLVFVALMVFAYTLYPKLSEQYIANAGGTPFDTDISDTADPLETKAPTPAVLADDFTVYDEDMNKVKLSDFFGTPIVVNFWATWCGPCKSELPAFDSARVKYDGEVIFLMVNLTDGYQDTVDRVKTFVSDGGYGFPVYFDTEYDAATTFGVYSIPETLFINADGSLMDIRIGAMSESVLESYIARLIANTK